MRRTLSQLIFAWGSVVSAAIYALLTLLGREPFIDDHLTATAVTMLGCYLLARLSLDVWRQRAELTLRRRRGEE